MSQVGRRHMRTRLKSVDQVTNSSINELVKQLSTLCLSLPILITGPFVGQLLYASVCQSGTNSSTNELATQSASMSVYLVFESVDGSHSVGLFVCLHEIYRFDLYSYFFASFSIKPLNNQIINQLSNQSISISILSIS